MSPDDRRQARPNGTYVLVALDAQIAGYVLRLLMDAVVVMCGRVRVQREVQRRGVPNGAAPVS
jgi:hypothetical protein